MKEGAQFADRLAGADVCMTEGEFAATSESLARMRDGLQQMKVNPEFAEFSSETEWFANWLDSIDRRLRVSGCVQRYTKALASVMGSSMQQIFCNGEV